MARGLIATLDHRRHHLASVVALVTEQDKRRAEHSPGKRVEQVEGPRGARAAKKLPSLYRPIHPKASLPAYYQERLGSGRKWEDFVYLAPVRGEGMDASASWDTQV